MAGSFRKYYHFVAPSCKLELARFSAKLRIKDGAECGKNQKYKLDYNVELHCKMQSNRKNQEPMEEVM